MQAAYQHHHPSMTGQGAVENKHQQFDHTVNQQAASTRHTAPNALLSDQVAANLENTRATLDSKENKLQANDKPHKDSIKNRVEIPQTVMDIVERAALSTTMGGVVHLPEKTD